LKALLSTWLEQLVSEKLRDFGSLLLSDLKTAAHEVACNFTDWRFRREGHFGGVEYCFLLEDALLSELVSEGPFAVDALVEDDADAPHVDLGGDFRRLAMPLESLERFRRQIPIGACSLRCEFYTGVAILTVLDLLRQTEVGEFNFTGGTRLEEYVRRLQIVMDDPALAQIFQSADDLHDNAARLLLRNLLVLLEIEIQIVAVAVFQHRAERVIVDGEQIEEANDPWMIQPLMDVLLPHRMLHVVGLLILFPFLVDLVDLARDVAVLI